MRITSRERSGGQDETATWFTKIIRGYRKYEHIQQQTRRRMDESSEKEFARVVPSANSVCA